MKGASRLVMPRHWLTFHYNDNSLMATSVRYRGVAQLSASNCMTYVVRTTSNIRVHLASYAVNKRFERQ